MKQPHGSTLVARKANGKNKAGRKLNYSGAVKTSGLCSIDGSDCVEEPPVKIVPDVGGTTYTPDLTTMYSMQDIEDADCPQLQKMIAETEALMAASKMSLEKSQAYSQWLAAANAKYSAKCTFMPEPVMPVSSDDPGGYPGTAPITATPELDPPTSTDAPPTEQTLTGSPADTTPHPDKDTTIIQTITPPILFPYDVSGGGSAGGGGGGGSDKATPKKKNYWWLLLIAVAAGGYLVLKKK